MVISNIPLLSAIDQHLPLPLLFVLAFKVNVPSSCLTSPPASLIKTLPIGIVTWKEFVRISPLSFVEIKLISRLVILGLVMVNLDLLSIGTKSQGKVDHFP